MTQADRADSPLVYTIADAADALSISTRTLWRQINSGSLRSVKLSTRRRGIPATEIRRIIDGPSADPKAA